MFASSPHDFSLSSKNRNSHSEVFCKKGSLKFAKLTGKHLCQSLFSGCFWTKGRLWEETFVWYKQFVFMVWDYEKRINLDLELIRRAAPTKNNNFFAHKIFSWCSIILFLSTWNTFLCYINSFFIDMKYFSVQHQHIFVDTKLLSVQRQTFCFNTKLFFVEHQIFVLDIV